MRPQLRIKESRHTREIARQRYDVKELIRRAYRELKEIGVHSKIMYQLLGRCPAIYEHKVYTTKGASILIHVWPSGELLAIPVVDDVAILHYNQEPWLKYYPFCDNKGGCWKIWTEDFEVEKMEISKASMFIGRDHWGHNVLDYYSQHELMTRTIINRYGLKYMEDVKILMMPLDKNSKFGIMSFMKTFALEDSLVHFKRPKASTIIKIYGDVIVGDSGPPFISLIKQEQTSVWSSDGKEGSEVIYVGGTADYLRIYNYYSFIVNMRDSGVRIENALNAYDERSAESVYRRAKIVITIFGSTLLNPIYFSNAKIITLYPAWFFDGTLANHELEALGDVAMLFGTRIFPVLGKPVKSRISGDNRDFNSACAYDTSVIIEKAWRLIKDN